MLLGDGALFEILLHQLVFALGDQLDQRLMAGLCVGGKAVGDLADFAAAVAAWGVEERLHGHQVHDAMETLRIGDGQLDRDAITAPAVDKILDEGAQAAATAGFGVVHLVDDDDAGDAGLFGISPHPLGHGFYAILGVD